jgi:hypothetical protein
MNQNMLASVFLPIMPVNIDLYQFDFSVVAVHFVVIWITVVASKGLNNNFWDQCFVIDFSSNAVIVKVEPSYDFFPIYALLITPYDRVTACMGGFYTATSWEVKMFDFMFFLEDSYCLDIVLIANNCFNE